MYVDISEFKISDWRNRTTTNLVLRIFANQTFVADDGQDGDLIEANVAYGQVPVTVADETVNGYTSPTLTIPALKLHSTTDALVNRNSTYRAEIWSTRLNKRLETLSLLSSFRVTFTEFATTWVSIIQFNTPLPLSVMLSLDEEIKSLINSQFNGLNFDLGSGTPERIAQFNSLGVGLEDTDYATSSSALFPVAVGKDLGTTLLPFDTAHISTVDSDLVDTVELDAQKYTITGTTKRLESTIGSDTNAQYARISDSVLGVATQTIYRESLLQTGTGGGVQSNLALYAIPTNHPSSYEGEKYTFKVWGDATANISTKVLECRTSEGTALCSLSVAPGVTLKWEAEISVTLWEKTTPAPKVIITASIRTSNGQNTVGVKTASSLSTLSGFTFFLAATDSGAAETRSLLAEVIHEDWSKN